jgi:hypothetical protein
MSLTPSDFRDAITMFDGFGDVIFAANSKHGQIISGQPPQSCFIKRYPKRGAVVQPWEYPKRISVSCVARSLATPFVFAS